MGMGAEGSKGQELTSCEGRALRAKFTCGGGAKGCSASPSPASISRTCACRSRVEFHSAQRA